MKPHLRLPTGKTQNDFMIQLNLFFIYSIEAEEIVLKDDTFQLVYVSKRSF